MVGKEELCFDLVLNTQPPSAHRMWAVCRRAPSRQLQEPHAEPPAPIRPPACTRLLGRRVPTLFKAHLPGCGAPGAGQREEHGRRGDSLGQSQRNLLKTRLLPSSPLPPARKDGRPTRARHLPLCAFPCGASASGPGINTRRGHVAGRTDATSEAIPRVVYSRPSLQMNELLAAAFTALSILIGKNGP